MDSTVIQEIANQLGMAVDKTGEFIQGHLPEFAALKTLQSSVPLIIGWSLFAISLSISLIALASVTSKVRKEVKRKLKDIEEQNYGGRYEYNDSPDDYTGFKVFAIFGVIAVFAFCTDLLISGICIPDIIGWSNYPEAMLLDMAIKAVG